MSGGSWNYLYSKDISDLVTQLHELEAMADRLMQVSPKAARRTRMLAAGLKFQLERLEKEREKLAPLWRAVEWCDSADTSEEDLRKECAEWERENK